MAVDDRLEEFHVGLGLKPMDADEQAFYFALQSGDSGSPRFLIVNDELILLFTIHLWSNSGPGLTANIAAVNSAMTTLGGGYQLTLADLSSFTDYST